MEGRTRTKITKSNATRGSKIVIIFSEDIYMEKQVYKITKDNADGSREVVWSLRCTEPTALEKFNEIVEQQANELHVLKTISTWRPVRLLDEQENEITHE